MSSIETELDRADQTASTEPNAASAANDVDKEVDMTGGDDTDTDESELIDYNEQEAVEAAEKAARKKSIERNANEQRIHAEKPSQNRACQSSLYFAIVERR